MSDTSTVNKILFLNLPHQTRVQRRYMCSYNTPSMLFPPIEMLYLAAIAREWHHLKVDLLDVKNENNTSKFLSIFEVEVDFKHLIENPLLLGPSIELTDPL